jgi:NADH-quinone oxidoreductase subunit L
MNDIKRVLAYSTISQLGYMMAALGVGAYSAAVFHLVTHAAFKALLFLGAGSVNHAAGTFDMRYMGGLWRRMPWTYLLTAIGGLSLVGIFPLAGFWSKDEILVGAWTGSGLVSTLVSRLTFAMLLAGVLLTGFYTLRMLYLTFHGEFRGGGQRELEDQAAEARRASTQPAPAGAAHPSTGPEGLHLGESPAVMVLPMVVLGVAAVAVGYVANPQWEYEFGIPGHWISGFLLSGLEAAAPAVVGRLEVHDFSRWIATVSTIGAVAGLAAAGALYLRRAGTKVGPLKTAKRVHTLLSQKYYVDALYEDAVVRRAFYRSFAGAVDWLDRALVDGLVDALGWFFRNIGSLIGRLQTGQVQAYGVVIGLGILLILLGFLLS